MRIKALCKDKKYTSDLVTLQACNRDYVDL